MPVPIPEKRVVSLPRGDQGTAATVSYLARCIKQGASSTQIRSIAVSLAMHQKNDIDKARSLFEFVKSRMRYIRDNLFMEQIGTPGLHVKTFVASGFAAGDCDDHVVLLGSLLTSIGYPVRIVTIRARPGYGPYDHVYLETLIRGVWIPMDATNKKMPMGWAFPNPTRIRRYNI